MWTVDEFLERCSESDGAFYNDSIWFEDYLEMMSLGSISADEWDARGKEIASQNWNWTWDGVIRDDFWEPFKKLWKDAGVPESWWSGYPGIGLTYAELAHAVDVMSGYAEAIESGVPIEDIIA